MLGMGGSDTPMDQDTALGVQMATTQAELSDYRAAGRVGEYAVVFRTFRNRQGGGYGDQERHPYAWGVLVYIDGIPARLYSARGHAREWTSFERLEKWLRAQGFWYWWMRNDLEVLYEGETEPDDGEALP